MAKLTKLQAEAKVYSLTEQLLEIKRQQKEANAVYKEEIKDIESEIKAIIEDENHVAGGKLPDIEEEETPTVDD
jgi:uncharacterized protein YydD (DUF2326 family)